MKFADDVTERLTDSNNLLAFSGGADSTALFFLLIEQEIPFDIAIVNYHTRPQSDDECAYAARLAHEYGKVCHIHHAEPIGENFEHRARAIRYDFFASLAKTHGYGNIITAHQLDDRLEWLLMQLTKGAGLIEMMGMQPVEVSEGYTIVRPLLGMTKAVLKTYLQEAGRHWFEDESNHDERYRRNYFRTRFSEPLMRDYSAGIAKSFAYLDEDRNALTDETDVINAGELYLFATRPGRRATLAMADRILKRHGFLMRAGDKERLKQEDCVVVGRRYAVAIGSIYTMIAPYEEAVMDKGFKEQCRRLGIPPKLRGSLYSHGNVFERLRATLERGNGPSS